MLPAKASAGRFQVGAVGLVLSFHGPVSFRYDDSGGFPLDVGEKPDYRPALNRSARTSTNARYSFFLLMLTVPNIFNSCKYINQTSFGK